MTISEIAKTHNGRKFKRVTSDEILYFDHPKAAIVLNSSELAADDWEFIQETMEFVEAVSKLKSAAEHGVKNLTQIRRIGFKWVVRRQKDSHVPLFLLAADGNYAGNYEPSVDEMLATDWIVEAVK